MEGKTLTDRGGGAGVSTLKSPKEPYKQCTCFGLSPPCVRIPGWDITLRTPQFSLVGSEHPRKEVHMRKDMEFRSREGLREGKDQTGARLSSHF